VSVIPEDAIGRSADEVFEDHLRLRSQGDLETDLQRNYADDVVLLCELGALKGRAAIRKSARRLGLQLPDAEFQFPTKLVEGEYAFLVWNARSQHFEVEDGADSFVIRGGRIVAQTIFYRLSKGSLDSERQDHRRASRSSSAVSRNRCSEPSHPDGRVAMAINRKDLP
jgi:SnoaL-like domain